MTELDPLCFKSTIGMAVTNRGELIPCCRCDRPDNLDDPLFKYLLDVSKISEYNTIQEILDTEEWKNFYYGLSQNIGPMACVKTCSKERNKDKTQTFKILDPKTGEVKAKQIR